MFNYFAYILHSGSTNKFYVGYTQNLELRLEHHNSGLSKFTSRGIPWKLVYREGFVSKSEAIKREKEIKSKKSRKYIEKLITEAGGRPE